MAYTSDHYLGKAKELLESRYVNDTLLAVFFANKAYSIGKSDNALEIAHRAGSMIGNKWKHETDRILRTNRFTPEIISAFNSLLYNGNPIQLSYSRKDDNAILIAGDISTPLKCRRCGQCKQETDQRFHKYVKDMKAFLIDDLGFVSDNLVILEADESTIARSIILGNQIERIREYFERNDMVSNIVIYYAGHGQNGSIALTDDSSLDYYKMFAPFRSHRGNMIFINESCHAASASQALNSLGLLPNRMMFLSASEKDENGFGNHFTDTVIKSYKNGCTIETGKISNETAVGIAIEIGDKIIPLPFLLEPPSQTYSRIGADFNYLLTKK
ncbi:MAG: hypothetical protein V1870_02540 [Candidatus Aenigmatarchaeota archaeon]